MIDRIFCGFVRISLERDPGEFENLWTDEGYRDVRFELMKRSFDALANAVDVGPKQVTQF